MPGHEPKDVKKSILSFAFIAFALLGVLFGMNIMSFIFGNLSDVDLNFVDTSVSVVNESGGFLNSSGYTLAGVSARGFNGGITISEVVNGSGAVPVENYTLDATRGVIFNGSNAVFDSVNVTYTYNIKSDAELNADGVNNESLNAVVTYANASNTQFSTLSIAITLVILLSVFAFFWFFFMGNNGALAGSSSNSKNGNFT